MNATEFGRYLRSLRKAQGLTLTQLGNLIGYSNPYLSQIENGQKGIPSPDILKKLASPLGEDYLVLMRKAGHIPENEIFHVQSPQSNLDEHIRQFIHLLLGDRDRDFYFSIKREFSNRIEELFQKHGVKSTKTITITDENGVRDDTPDQYAEMIIDIDNAQFKWDVLQELQDIAHEFHMRFNPAYEFGIRQPRPKKLEQILEQGNITYHGHPLTDQDKQLITAYLDALFRDRISEK